MANVGDTKGVLFEEAKFNALTYDHKATDTKEHERIKEAGGSVIYGRVGGALAVSRAFGDYGLKDFGVIVTPHVTKTELRVIHKFIVVATDGLWDVVSDKEIHETLKTKSTIEDVAKTLIKKAVAQGSRDNISVLCLKL
jgi:serine/threonine protein phosphatase PrpC